MSLEYVKSKLKTKPNQNETENTFAGNIIWELETILEIPGHQQTMILLK